MAKVSDEPARHPPSTHMTSPAAAYGPLIPVAVRTATSPGTAIPTTGIASSTMTRATVTSISAVGNSCSCPHQYAIA
ncbi:hypothetical protein [Planosporangium thailandense]|uniref:hypothetical protein n=1 Tax=Planosporangium thailandense TaxID=765197 RepID=UPI001F0DE209|nr:hypothetical protein [Planosporangium thailandense]